MTVADLIEALQQTDPDRIVVLAGDAEGNDFAALQDLSLNRFDGESIGLESLTDAHKAKGYTEEDVMKRGKSAVVLWP